MISCRVPKVWDMAIRWCKCRQRWIDLVYNKHLKRLNTNCMASKKENNSKKSEIVKRILNPTITKFEDCTGLSDMVTYNNPDYEYWKTVCSWEEFFRKHGIYWKNFVQNRAELGKFEISAELSAAYHINEDLANFIVNAYYHGPK